MVLFRIMSASFPQAMTNSWKLIPALSPPPWIAWRTKRPLSVSRFRLVAAPGAVRKPTLVRVSWPGGRTPPLRVGPSGAVTLPTAVRAKSFRVTIVASAFPPGGKQTLMRRCDLCGVLTPPQTIEGGECLDHAQHIGWGPSPSADAIREAQRLHLRVRFTDLEPESTEALQKEIGKARARAARDR